MVRHPQVGVVSTRQCTRVAYATSCIDTDIDSARLSRRRGHCCIPAHAHTLHHTCAVSSLTCSTQAGMLGEVHASASSRTQPDK